MEEKSVRKTERMWTLFPLVDKTGGDDYTSENVSMTNAMSDYFYD